MRALAACVSLLLLAGCAAGSGGGSGLYLGGSTGVLLRDEARSR